MSSGQIAIIVVVLLLVAGGAVAGWMYQRRRALRERFGPEYDRLVEEKESRADAEAELRERERKHDGLELRPLPDEARTRYAEEWDRVQARFVEAPDEAVVEADALVTRLVADRGYPTGDYEQQLAQLSVEHARTLGHYRDAHDIHERHQRGEASTEQLRQALVHYRALFDDLLGTEPVRTKDSSTPPSEPSTPDATRR